jgi:hypothetical protein
VAGESAQLADQITIFSRIPTLTHYEQRVAATFNRVPAVVSVRSYADPKTGATQGTRPNPSIATLVVDNQDVRQWFSSPNCTSESTFGRICADGSNINIHKST